MYYNATNDNIINDEILETKAINKHYKPRDPHQNTYYYHTHVAPVECNICICSVVNSALYNDQKTAKCKLVKHFKDIAQSEYNTIKLIQYIMAAKLIIQLIQCFNV